MTTGNTTNRIVLSPSTVRKLAAVHKRAVWKTTTTREAVKNAAELIDAACDLLRLATDRNEAAERKNDVLEQMKVEDVTPSGLLEELEDFVRRVHASEDEKTTKRRKARQERQRQQIATTDGNTDDVPFPKDEDK